MIVACASCSRPNRVPASRLAQKAHCAECKSPLLPLTHPVPVGSEAEFDELIGTSPLPVLVDFWAAWCGPCLTVAPEIEKVAHNAGGRLAVAKVDTEAVPGVAARFGIRSIPTMILFRQGREVKRISGAMSAQRMEAQLAT